LTKIAGYEVHPAAELFPLLRGAEFDKLVASIKADGLLHPLVVHRGVLLDGRNRALACQKAGVKPGIEKYDGDTSEDGIERWIVSTNLRRRHLNESQRGIIGARIKKREAERAAKRRGKRTDLVKNSSPSRDAGKARDKAAEQVNVSGYTVDAAEKVIDRGVPELVAACEDGDLAVSAAARLAGRPAEDQRAALEKINSGEARNVFQAVRQVDLKKQLDAAPKIETPQHRVLHGDAIALLREHAPRAHCVVTDPPYGLSTHRTREGGHDYADGEEYAVDTLRAVCAELSKCVDPSAHLYFFAGYGLLGIAAYKVIAEFFDVQLNPLVWVKDNHTMCDFTKWYASKYEHVIFAKVRGSERRLSTHLPVADVLSVRRERDSTHSAQKPVDLLRHFIERSTAPGELVLDPFCGSGSTGVAAAETGREFIGFEVEEKWVEVARARIAGGDRAA
jgi:DNA modification methylase/ParB-like chromosome segregation protein Spo0J